jgi:ATP-dependent DNA ligase
MVDGRVRAGFTPHSRRAIYNKMRHLETSRCPFANLPDKHVGQWGQGITPEKMKECIWLKPEMVAQIEFAEWTPGDRLRQASFAGLRDDKDPKMVVKET